MENALFCCWPGATPPLAEAKKIGASVKIKPCCVGARVFCASPRPCPAHWRPERLRRTTAALVPMSHRTEWCCRAKGGGCCSRAIEGGTRKHGMVAEPIRTRGHTPPIPCRVFSQLEPSLSAACASGLNARRSQCLTLVSTKAAETCASVLVEQCRKPRSRCIPIVHRYNRALLSGHA